VAGPSTASKQIKGLSFPAIFREKDRPEAPINPPKNSTFGIPLSIKTNEKK
jgi:hypothetical protein